MLSNNNYTTEILDLQGAIVKNIETAANNLTVHAEMPAAADTAAPAVASASPRKTPSSPDVDK